MCGCLAALVRGRPLWGKILAAWPAVGRLVVVVLFALPIYLNAHLWLGAFTVTLGPLLQGGACAYSDLFADGASGRGHGAPC